MLDVLHLCNNKVTVEEPWAAFVPDDDDGGGGDGDDDRNGGDGPDSGDLRPQNIGTNTYGGSGEDFSDINYMVVNFLEVRTKSNAYELNHVCMCSIVARLRV